MHIPDGYLSPKTCVAFLAAMAPVWFIASRRVEATLKIRQLPFLAFGAAFAFIIQMFNIPIPGGSTGHMTGAAVVAIILGPWAGVVAMTLTLALQAFLFGDGGILALGANAFNMAFLMSFSSYYIFRAIAGDGKGVRRTAGAFIAGYAALNLAALAVGVEMGLQPHLAHTPDGRALYAPYPLTITIPAMAIPHLLFFGPVEGVGTALVIGYLYKHNEELGRVRPSVGPLWVILAILVALTPLGLLAAGSPWGEWTSRELKEIIGYAPEGMRRFEEGWKGILPGYSIPGLGGGDTDAFTYIISALAGTAVLLIVIYVWGRLWPRR